MSNAFTPSTQVLLAPHTTFQIGGPAEYFTTITSVQELVSAYQWANDRNVPVTILGGGSNVLVRDAGVPGLVVQMATTGRKIESETDETVTVTYQAGMSFDEVVADTVASGWWGLENLSHIPGTVGATPVQNVGAYGVEVADCICAVEVFCTLTKEIKTFSRERCDFAYRSSYFKQPAGQQYVVIAVTFTLNKVPQPHLDYKDLQSLQNQSSLTQADIRAAVIAVRAGKFPDWHTVGTAGSFFKNPTISVEHYRMLLEQYPGLPGYPQADGQCKIALGWILDVVCGYKGYQTGAVGTYEAQALVLINHGGATASEVEALATTLAAVVQKKTGIEIEWEVTKLPTV